MTTFEERSHRPINPEQHKAQTRKRLNAIFDRTFDEFSKLISQKNICGLMPFDPPSKPQVKSSQPQKNELSPPRQKASPQPTLHHAPTVSNSSASTSSAPAPAKKESSEKQMTTEELLQSMQSLVGVKEPMASLPKPREQSSSALSSSRGNPPSSSTTHRTSTTSSSSGSSRRDRDREKDREKDRDRDRDVKDSRDRRSRDSERERRPSKWHRPDERPRQREDRCSNVASTSTGRSSKEREEHSSAESGAPKNIDSLFVPNTSSTTNLKRYRGSPQDDLFADDEVKDAKRKRKKTSEDAKWNTTCSGSDEVQSPDSGISLERGDSDDAAVNEEVVAPPEEEKSEIDMPIDDILKMMTSLIGPLEPIKLPYKTLGELQNVIRPPPPVLQPMKPLPKATNRATSPMAPPKRPLATVSPMRPFRDPLTNRVTSPSSPCRSTKISLNLSVLPSEALRRLKKEHAKALDGRPPRLSPAPGHERTTSRSSKRSSDGKRSRPSPSWSPRSSEKSIWSRQSRSPQPENAKKRRNDAKSSSNHLEVPQSSSKPPSRSEMRTPSPMVSKRRRRSNMNLEEVFGPNCCAPKHRPKTALFPNVELPEDENKAYDTILRVGTELKHRADKNKCNKMRLGKQLLYLESCIYFMYACSKNPSDHLVIYNQLCQTINFLKSMQKQSAKTVMTNEFDRHFLSRFHTLIRRAQSALAYHLYDSMNDPCNKRFDLLQKLEAKRPQLPSDLSSGDSIRSDSSMSNRTIEVDMQLYALQTQQLKLLSHIYWAHRMWKDVDASLSPIDQAMEREVNRLCGPLHVGSPLVEIVEHLYTALMWLKKEYHSAQCVVNSSSSS